MFHFNSVSSCKVCNQNFTKEQSNNNTCYDCNYNVVTKSCYDGILKDIYQ